jgi:hypothetical protein
MECSRRIFKIHVIFIRDGEILGFVDVYIIFQKQERQTPSAIRLHNVTRSTRLRALLTPPPGAVARPATSATSHTPTGAKLEWGLSATQVDLLSKFLPKTITPCNCE